MRHINSFTIRRYGKLIDAKRVVGDPGYHVMHEVVGYQAAIFARANVHATLGDVEYSLFGSYRYATLACFGNGELLHKRMVVVYVIGINLAIIHYIQPVRSSAAARVGSDTDREGSSGRLEALGLEGMTGSGIFVAPLHAHHTGDLLGSVTIGSSEGPVRW